MINSIFHSADDSTAGARCSCKRPWDNRAFSLGCPIASECKNVIVFCAHAFLIPCLIQYIGQPVVDTKLCPPTTDMQCKLSSLVHQQWTLTWESAHSLSIAFLTLWPQPLPALRVACLCDLEMNLCISKQFFYIPISLDISLYLSLRLSLSFSLSIYIYKNIYISISLYMSLYLHIFQYLFISPHLSIYIYICIYSISFYIVTSLSLSIYICISL